MPRPIRSSSWWSSSARETASSGSFGGTDTDREGFRATADRLRARDARSVNPRNDVAPYSPGGFMMGRVGLWPVARRARRAWPQTIDNSSADRFWQEADGARDRTRRAPVVAEFCRRDAIDITSRFATESQPNQRVGV